MSSAAVTRARPRAEHPTLRFVGRRVLRLVVSLAVLLVVTFAMIHLIPGDPVRAALGPRAPQTLVDERRDALGLNDPLPEQLVDYVTGVVSGDFGTSLVSNLPVSEIIADRLPNTASLAGLAFLAIVVLAVPIGILAALLTRGGRRRRVELAFTSSSGVLAVIPEFVLGVGLVYIFGVSLGWLPVAEQAGPASYVLPVAALSLGSIAALARIVRLEMLTVLEQDYMRTARSKRLPARTEYLRHALPNALTATLTYAGLLLGGLVGGTVLVENVFAWPGLGAAVVDSVVRQDYDLAQAVMLMLGAAILIINFVVDLLLAAVDPRSRIHES